MDACHSGNLFDGSSPGQIHQTAKETGKDQRGSKAVSTKDSFKTSDLIATMFDNFHSNSGITILSASAGEDVAFEYKELGNGAFSKAIIDELISKLKGSFGLVISEDNLKNPVLLTDEMIYEIQKKVLISTDSKQLPDIREKNPYSTIYLW